MSSTGELLGLAVPVAVAGAAAMGLADATQSQATKQVPHGGILAPRLLWNLLRNRTWLVGIVATVAGLGLQLVALGFGPLLLVQPLLVTELLFTAVFAAWLRRAGVERVVVSAALLCAAGLGAFVLLARPHQGDDTLSVGPRALPLAVVLAAVLAGCLVLARRGSHLVRVLALALATGVLYGVTAGLMKLVSGQFRVGLAAPFTHWALYVAVATGITGFLLSQNTFQQGRHVAPAVAVINTVDPLIGIGIGAVCYGESVVLTPAVLFGQIVAGCVIVAAIVVLARACEGVRGAGQPVGRPGVTSASAGAGAGARCGRPAAAAR